MLTLLVYTTASIYSLRLYQEEVCSASLFNFGDLILSDVLELRWELLRLNLAIPHPKWDLFGGLVSIIKTSHSPLVFASCGLCVSCCSFHSAFSSQALLICKRPMANSRLHSPLYILSLELNGRPRWLLLPFCG